MIELTNDQGKVFLTEPGNVFVVCRHADDDKTTIMMAGNFYVKVNESPEEIAKLLRPYCYFPPKDRNAQDQEADTSKEANS